MLSVLTAQRSRAVLLLVPGVLLTLAGHALILAGQPWWLALGATSVGSALIAGPALLVMWAIREAG